MESKKDATKLTQRIIRGEYGKDAKFICEYTKTHLVTLNALVDPSGYSDFFKQFIKISNDYIEGLKPGVSLSPNTSELIELGPSAKQNNK